MRTHGDILSEIGSASFPFIDFEYIDFYIFIYYDSFCTSEVNNEMIIFTEKLQYKLIISGTIVIVT